MGAVAPPVIEDQPVPIGASTLSGHGGGGLARPSYTGTVTSFAISGGQSANYNVDESTGYLTPSSDGAATNGDTFTYTVTGPGGEDSCTITVSAAANTYSVKDNTEVSAVLAIATATVAGKTIKLRSGSYTSITFTNKAYGSAVTLTSEAGAVIAGVTLQNSNNVTVTGNKISIPLTPASTVVQVNGPCDGTVISDNEICSDEIVDVTSESWATDGTALTSGISTSNSGGLPVALTITGNNIHDVNKGVVVAPTGALIVNNNTIKRYKTIGIQVSQGPTSTTIKGNDISHPFSRGSDTGNPHGDGIMTLLGIIGHWLGQYVSLAAQDIEDGAVQGALRVVDTQP